MTVRNRNLGDVMGDRRRSADLGILSVDPNEGVREWRCNEIEAGTLSYAALLQRRGIEPGSTVGLLAKNSVHNLMAYQGIMRAGCVCVPVNIRQPAGIVRYICDDANIRFAFTDGSAHALIPEGIEQVRLGAIETEAVAPPLPEVDWHSTALILYTSGSTGRPKGVVLSHFSQLAMIDAVTGGTEGRLFAGQRGIVVAPMFHMNALVFNRLVSQGRRLRRADAEVRGGGIRRCHTHLRGQCHNRRADHDRDAALDLARHRQAAL